MATMYVYNIPTNETVNLRKTASSSGTILVRVGYGKAVQANYYNSTWHSATYKGYSGYIMSKFLSETNPNGGSGNSDSGTGIPTAGVIKGTKVRVRKMPNTTSDVLTQVNTGDKVTYYAGESYSGSGYTWYRCTSSKWRGDGYIATNYVVKDSNSSGGGSSSGTSDDFTDIVNTNPTVIGYCSYDPQAAKEYALAHSSNTNENSKGDKVADPNRNTSFREGASNACANFVHQCLLAGGARMFDSWCYKLPGIPSNWNSESWTLTNKGRRRLLEKKWIKRIPYTAVKTGDIIYTYYEDYRSRNMNTPFSHVTIAVSNYDASTGKCMVCGHTKNQHSVYKKLSSTGIPCTYCYHVNPQLGIDGSEKIINLTDGNSSAR